MGTTQNIAQQKIRKAIRIGALILVPFIVIGGGSMIYQFSTGGIDSMDFSFNQLWSWGDKKKEQPIRVEESAIVQLAESRPFVRQLVQQRNTKAIETVTVAPVTRRVLQQVSSLSNTTFNKPTEEFKLLELKMRQPVDELNYLRTGGRYIDMSQKEFLIPQDITPERSRVAIGASFTPGIAYRHLRYSDINAVARIEDNMAYTFGQSKEYRNNNDKPIMNFYSGVDVYINLDERWNIQTGFHYASFGEKLTVIRKDDANAISPSISSSSAFLNKQSVFESPEMVEYSDNEIVPFSNYYGMMEIPVVASYRFKSLGEMTHLGVQLGCSYAYLDHADVLMYNYETNKYFWIPSSDFQLLNQHLLTGIAGVEMSQYISKEIEIFANPQFKYVVTPTFKRDYEIRQNQWSAGMRLGMKVHL